MSHPALRFAQPSHAPSRRLAIIAQGATPSTFMLLLMAIFVAYMRWHVMPIRPRTIA